MRAVVEAPRLSPLDHRQLRSCFGQFGSGVTVITYSAAGNARGATVSSFASVSLDPSLLLVCVDRRARACTGLKGAPFTVNVLRRDQMDLALHFAGRPQPELADPWAADTEVPRLEKSAAWFRCRPWRHYDGGDHIVFLGEVEDCGSSPDEPLIFHGGAFRELGAPLPSTPSRAETEPAAGSPRTRRNA